MVENSISSRSSLQAYASSHRSRAVFSSVSAVFFSVSKVILLLSSRSSCTVSANRSITAVRYPGKQRELLRKSRRDYAGDRRRKPGVTYRTASSRDLGLNPLRRRGIPCPEVADDPLRYDEALNLAGALVDLRHPRVPVVALHGMVLHVPLPAQDLDRLVGHLVRHGRGIKLGPRADLHVPEPLVLRPRRFVRQQTGRLELRLHVRELERHSLVLRYRLAERRPLYSVPARIPEGRFGYPQSLRRYTDTSTCQRPQSDPKPLPLFPQPILLGNEDILEEHVVGSSRDHAHLLGVLAEGDPLGVHADDEGRDALRSPGKEDHGARHAAVGDPLLVARDPVPARDLLGPRLYRRGVRARLGLGEGEAPDLRPRGQIWNPTGLLFLGAVVQDGECSRASVHRQRHPHARVGPAYLLDQQHVREEVCPAPAVPLRHAQAHEPGPRQLLEYLRRETVFSVPLCGVWGYLPIGELRRPLLNVLLCRAQVKVHGALLCPVGYS